MRYLLMVCGLINFGGAISFSPPLAATRNALGIPEPDPFYLWVLSSWILAFGVAYFYQGWTGHPNRTVLALGAWGKLVFVWQMAVLGIRDQWAPLAWGMALPDLVFGVTFGWWLWRYRTR
jgi:hypothetical protein